MSLGPEEQQIAEKLYLATKNIIPHLAPFVELAQVCEHFEHSPNRAICNYKIKGEQYSGPKVSSVYALRDFYDLVSSIVLNGVKEVDMETVQKALAYNEWPHATPEERKRWVDVHWKEMKYERNAQTVMELFNVK